MSILYIFLIFYTSIAQNTSNSVQIARLKYSGGGDWYNDPSSEVNLLNYLTQVAKVNTIPKYQFVDAASDEIFNFPFIFCTGHGNMNLTKTEVENLREYLLKGGFLFVDDDYGLDSFFRREIKRIFPEIELVELPFSHEIYHSFYDFNFGPPKTHEHDNKSPQGFGVFLENRLAVFYTFESNPSDGWADKEVHGNDDKTRELSLQFGVNILIYVLNN